MSLIDRDMQMLKECLDVLENEYEETESLKTNFINRKEMKRVVEPIQKYNYSSAIEIKQAIMELYEKAGERFSDELMKITEIALLKNKEITIEKETISTFVYEF